MLATHFSNRRLRHYTRLLRSSWLPQGYHWGESITLKNSGGWSQPLRVQRAIQLTRWIKGWFITPYLTLKGLVGLPHGSGWGCPTTLLLFSFSFSFLKSLKAYMTQFKLFILNKLSRSQELQGTSIFFFFFFFFYMSAQERGIELELVTSTSLGVVPADCAAS